MSRCGRCPLNGSQADAATNYGVTCKGDEGIEECAENLQSLVFRLQWALEKQKSFQKKENDNSALDKAIKAVSEMDASSGVSQSVYVVEECSELIKELMKRQREKGSEKDILAEACDVLTTIFVLLKQHNVSRNFVVEQILYKCNRALTRYHQNGEV